MAAAVQKKIFSKNRAVKITLRVLSYAILVLLSFMCLMPFYWLLRSSFMDLLQIFDNPPKLLPKPWVFTNFSDAMKVVPFGRYFGNTMLLVIVNVIGTVCTSVLCAYGFSRFKWKYRDTVFFILICSMMIPGAVLLIPTFLIWTNLRLVDTYVPLMLPSFFGGGIFNIFLVRQFMTGIPKELDESAKIDGAGKMKILIYILVPALRPVMTVILLFTFFNVWNDFFGPLIYLHNDRLFTLALGLRSFIGTMRGEWHMLMAASTLIIIPPLILFAIGQKHIIGGITFTGIKG